MDSFMHEDAKLDVEGHDSTMKYYVSSEQQKTIFFHPNNTYLHVYIDTRTCVMLTPIEEAAL